MRITAKTTLARSPWAPALAAFGLPYLLIELFYIGMPVVRTDVRTVKFLLKILES